MRLTRFKSTALIFLFILSLLTNNGCGKSPIENIVEEIVDASDTDDDTDSNDENDDDVDNDENDDEPIPSFTAKVNGDEFVASTLLTQSLTGAAINIGNAGYSIIITGQYWSQNLKSADVILLYAFGADFDELSVNTEFVTIGTILGTAVPGAFGIYGGDPDVDVDDDNFGTDVLEEISIKITAIDKEKKFISGEFSYIAIDEDTTQEYKVTEGVFTNLEYEIQ